MKRQMKKKIGLGSQFGKGKQLFKDINLTSVWDYDNPMFKESIDGKEKKS